MSSNQIDTPTPRRGDVLRTVVATVDRRRDGVLPMDLDGVAETFHGDLDLLVALMLKWHTRLTGHVERQLQSEPMDLSAAVVAAWCAAADELPGVRAVIDRHRDAPTSEAMATALGRSLVKEHSYLATMAGLASVHDLAGVPLGADLEDRARAARAAVPLLTLSEPAPHTLLERLRAALVA